MAYKNYCNRRTAKKGLEAEESHCCPLRMPIIGPILFSLFIFSPYFLPSNDSEKSQQSLPNSGGNEKRPPYQHIQQKSEADGEDLQDVQSQQVDKLGS